MRLSLLLLIVLALEAVALSHLGLALYRTGLAPVLAILFALIFALGWRALIVALTFGLSRVLVQSPSREGVKAMFGEIFSTLYLYSISQPLLALARGAEIVWKRITGNRDRTSARAGPVIILIHGFVCNAAMWNPLRRYLQSLGFSRCYALNLDPFYRDMGKISRDCEGKISRILKACGESRAVLIGHSMGGVLTRKLLLESPGQILCAITLAAPHHGTDLAKLVSSLEFGPCRPDSRWLEVINRKITSETKLAPLMNIYTETDNIVYPQRSAAWSRGCEVSADIEEHALNGIGHLQLAAHPKTFALVGKFLQHTLKPSTGDS